MTDADPGTTNPCDCELLASVNPTGGRSAEIPRYVTSLCRHSDREGGTTLVKPQLEVRLEKTESNHATVTKYSWR